MSQLPMAPWITVDIWNSFCTVLLSKLHSVWSKTLSRFELGIKIHHSSFKKAINDIVKEYILTQFLSIAFWPHLGSDTSPLEHLFNILQHMAFLSITFFCLLQVLHAKKELVLKKKNNHFWVCFLLSCT